MSGNRSYLALFFDAPLLSFGGESKFDRRDTLGFPSRGAVTGLVAAALGIDWCDRAGLARLAELAMVSIAFPGAPGTLLIDYHTVGGGYPKSSLREIPVSAEGSSRKTVVTTRAHLVDGKFAAILSGDSAFLAEIGEALRNPVWGGWIGRKHCIPATPVFQGVFDTESAALERLCSLAGDRTPRIWEECAPDTPGAMLYSDTPVDFFRREFRLRAVMER